MDRAERLYLKRADHVLAVSETDKNHFLNYLPESKLTIVPTGVDVEFFQPRHSQEEPDSLVFTGSMDWLPNEDGIVHFIEQVLPRIREQIPEVSLSVVGRKPSQKLQALGDRNKGVRITGWVDDIRPYLAHSAMCIVPLRIGGGTRLKIFEAMAMGKAMISTTIGAEGLPVRHSESIVLADDPEDFARQAVNLLRSPERRQHIGAAAHKMVTEKYSWAKVADGFAEVLERVSGSSSAKRAQIPVSSSILA